jgi:hypothetical protein
MQVTEAAALLEEAGLALMRDSSALNRSNLPDPPDGQKHDTFLRAWAIKLTASCVFLREQRMARVLDDETLLRLVALDVEIAQERLSA